MGIVSVTWHRARSIDRDSEYVELSTPWGAFTSPWHSRMGGLTPEDRDAIVRDTLEDALVRIRERGAA